MRQSLARWALAVMLLGLGLHQAMPASADEATTGGLDLAGGRELGTVISREPGGVVKITARGPSTVCLGVLPGPENAPGRLVYRAEVRVKGMNGKAFLEMWCVFPGGGRYFSRAFNQAVSGDQPWRTLSASFLLRPGQRPASVALSVVVFGEGEVWVKEPRLVMLPADAGAKQ